MQGLGIHGNLGDYALGTNMEELLNQLFHSGGYLCLVV